MISSRSAWLRSLRFASLLTKAQALAAQRKYGAAAAIVSKIFKVFDEEGASSNVPIIANILFGNLCDKINRPEVATVACEVALEQLDDYVPKDGGFNPEEIKYLKYQCKWILSGTSRYVDSWPFQRALYVNISFADLKLSGVRPRLRRLFPLSAEEGAALDLFFSQNSSS